MRIKTFFATYLLFLAVMFFSVGIVSAYLTNSQLGILREKSISQYGSIAASLTRDMGALQARNLPPLEFETALHNIMIGHQMYYYAQHDVVLLNLFYVSDAPQAPTLMFINNNVRRVIYVAGIPIRLFDRGNQEHAPMRLIQIGGTLPAPFSHYRLEYLVDITESIADMRRIQNMLLLTVAALSVVAAVGLYFTLAAIFKPFSMVAAASRSIAGGQFGQRIAVKGSSEIARLAQDFNHMAARIETQISQLEAEALAKQQFVDNFAHEIRTPLTSIYGYAEYMQKTRLDEGETIESAEYIMSESRHMRNIANSLLELAVLRDYVPVKADIDLPGLFEDVQKTLEGALAEKGTALETEADIETLAGQEDLIKSLILNLCTNGLKACRPGRGRIRLTATTVDGAPVISVKDNGCGIPAESLPKITDPFYRVDKSRNREDGGTGLGLALCGQIAKAHGAKMQVASTPGEGTQVDVIFTTS